MEAAKSIRVFKELDADFGQTQEAQRVTANLINALEVQELVASLPFDPLALYCIKTGQTRGSRDWPQIYQLAALHERNQAALVLTLLQQDGCAAHWLQTDGATLEKLRVLDPIGYFVYAASHLIAHKYKMPVVDKASEREARASLFAQKIQAYALLKRRFETRESCDTGVNFTLLHIANGHLRALLNYQPHMLRLPFATLEDVTRSLFAGNLYATLSHCFRTWLQRETEYFNPAKMFEVLNKSKGPGQFRAQRPSNATRRVDEMLSEIAALGIDLGQFREPRHDKAWMKTRLNLNANPKTLTQEEVRPTFTASNPRPGSFLARFAAPKSETSE